MAEIIARFADGRLLVHEDRLMEVDYNTSGGAPFRIGLVNVVEQVISIDTKISGYPGLNVAAPLNEVKVGIGALSGPWGGFSGPPVPITRRDVILPVLRRNDLLGMLSGGATITSGYPVIGALSRVVFSGTPFGGEILSGKTSGVLSIIANVIGY